MMRSHLPALQRDMPMLWRYHVLDAIWVAVYDRAVDERRTVVLSQSATDLHACDRFGWSAAELGL